MRGEVEVTTVADDLVVCHEGAAVHRFVDLEPDTEQEVCGRRVRTLPRPGRLLCRVATVNDLHLGEVECGRIEGLDIGPVLRSEPGEEPYPVTMSRGAVEEIAAIEPAAVVAKGDLTAHGRPEEARAFDDLYRTRFGGRLLAVRGNHDGTAMPDAAGPRFVEVPGACVAVLDTTEPGRAGGRVPDEQLDWLDALTAASDRPVLVFGHHPLWDPVAPRAVAGGFELDPESSARLVELAVRRPAMSGYFAGHTHRNRVLRLADTGDVPWAEVACVKDFPGSWAEYRIYDGGALQVHHRTSTPDALRWSERCRAMIAGMYPAYAFGSLDDRCFAIGWRQ